MTKEQRKILEMVKPGSRERFMRMVSRLEARGYTPEHAGRALLATVDSLKRIYDELQAEGKPEEANALLAGALALAFIYAGGEQ